MSATEVAVAYAAALQRLEVPEALAAVLAPHIAARANAGAKPTCSTRQRATPPPLPPTADKSAVAGLQRQVQALQETIANLQKELAKERGDPGASGAPGGGGRGSLEAGLCPSARIPSKVRRPRDEGGGGLATRKPPAYQAVQGAPQSPCVWKWPNTRHRHRHLGHRCRCICRAGHLPPHPFATSQLTWAREDIISPRSLITLWGVARAEPLAAPHQGLGRSRYVAVARSAGIGAKLVSVRVVAAPGRATTQAPPVQPTLEALRAMLPSTTALQPPYQEARDVLRELGTAQVRMGGGGGHEKIGDAGWYIFLQGGNPPKGGGDTKKVGPTKKIPLPTSHVPHIITVSPPPVYTMEIQSRFTQ